MRAPSWLTHLEFDWESPLWRHWLDGLAEGHLTGITPPLPAGATSFGVDCNQEQVSGAIQYDEVSASVVLISGS